MGKNLTADIEVLRAIRKVHPDCLFILDANEGYNSEEAIQVLEKLQGNEVILSVDPLVKDVNKLNICVCALSHEFACTHNRSKCIFCLPALKHTFFHMFCGFCKYHS